MKYYIEYLAQFDTVVHNRTVEADDIKEAIAKFEQDKTRPRRIINVSQLESDADRHLDETI